MMWKIFCLMIIGVGCTSALDNRHTRQLDLGPAAAPQTQPRDSTFQQPGYLPPVNEIAPAGAQNDVTVLRPTPGPIGPTHHGRDLCTDPFHSFLCASLKPRRVFTGARPNSIEGANSFNVPSKVLAPPLNDLVELPETTPRPTTTRRPTTTPRPSTTTRRPTTTTTTTTSRPSTTVAEPIVGPAASSDVRTYLPPENIAPAAASNDPAIVAPEHHEHHHPHHHGRDLCTDPFHSFLCQPLKPRKRISGDLPNRLQGQNSFQSVQKVKPEPEVKPQPSNNIDLAYLPPSTTTRRPVITTTTIRTTPFRRISPQPSNDINRIYLPPVSTTRRPTTTTTIQPAPSNVQNAYLPPALPEPTNINNNYLPPEPKIEPAAAQNDPAVVAPDHDHHHGSHGFKDICSDPFHSFLCTVPKTRTRITGALPPHLRNLISPAPSNVDETRVKPSSTTTTTTTEKIPVPQPDTLVPVQAKPDGYSYPKPVKPFPQPSENQPTKGYNYPKPDVRLTLPSDIRIEVVSTTTTRKPTTTTPKPTTTSTRRPTTLQPAASNEIKGYDYPKPEIKFPPPQKGYDYPKPDVKLTLPSENKPVGYNYPKPEEPNKGYEYPKPSSQFSQQTLKPKASLPGSIQEARERLQSLQGKESQVQKISNISSQNDSSDLITVNHVEFNGGFGQRLQRRVRKGRNLIPPPGSHAL